MRRIFHLLGRSLLLVCSIFGATLLLETLTFSTAGEGTDAEHQRLFNESYKVFSLTLPDKLDFCGENVPMDLLDVRERLDRELLVNTYWQSSSLLAHKRANRWFPVIEPILKRNGVPEDMKYIPLVESAFTNITSPAGATGFWQFMKETAKGHGLEVNDQVDERYNVEKATQAACDYLKEAHVRYGSWAMAAASYNLGQGNIERQLGRQKTQDYFALLLPDETSRYVFRILAMKAIISDPDRYGFHLRARDLYPPYKTRSVDISGNVDDLNEFAVRQGTDYKTLKLLNPWLRDNALTNSAKKTYTVLLPAEGFNNQAVGDD
ncbi:MAG: lytic transglycosylase domain-containing protein [Flavobacteriales bacterium]|jgi:membrane-bound lytic murein transglycosylase D|nr:lytic transglycosylase domain-containing protein [Flavobacteriales bacterium]MBP9159709.1 lytic transglycosylase domain-containing protein [Flavobacteriales bacterium]MCI1753215.1 lytic transglycosylase domain-containing protein [Flavobacteriales bacterium]